MIEIKDCTKYFGSICAVGNLTLEIGDHEVFGLVGTNGAGKSTTIDLILGLKAPMGASRRFWVWTPPNTENRCLNGWEYSFRIPSISQTSP